MPSTGLVWRALFLDMPSALYCKRSLRQMPKNARSREGGRAEGTATIDENRMILITATNLEARLRRGAPNTHAQYLFPRPVKVQEDLASCQHSRGMVTVNTHRGVSYSREDFETRDCASRSSAFVLFCSIPNKKMYSIHNYAQITFLLF